MIELSALSRRFGVNAEVGEGWNFPVFYRSVAAKRVLLLADLNTEKYATPLCSAMQERGILAKLVVLSEAEPVADEKTVAGVLAAADVKIF